MSMIFENVEYIADIYATVNCFSPVPAFYDCIKDRNYNAISSNYYIMTTAMNFSWVIYAIKMQHDVLYTVSLKYALIYAIFAFISISLRKEFKKIFYLIAFIAVEYYILNMLDNHYLGLACTIVQFISDSSQWESIILTAKAKNSSYVNIKQQVISVISSILWTLIGIKTGDLFLILPNGYNSLLHLIQITLAIYFYQNVSSKKAKQN